jgi:hypothetical protein
MQEDVCNKEVVNTLRNFCLAMSPTLLRIKSNNLKVHGFFWNKGGMAWCTINKCFIATLTLVRFLWS